MNPVSRYLVCCSLGVLSVNFASAANYASDASARLSGLTFTLIDLDLADGIDPSFEFLAGEFGSSLYARAYSPGDWAVSSRDRQQDALSSSSLVEAQAQFTVAQAEAFNNNLAVISSYDIDEDGSHYALSTYAFSQFALSPAERNNFVLGPNSAVKITANVELMVTRYSDCSPCHGFGSTAASASVGAFSYRPTTLIFDGSRTEYISVTERNDYEYFSDTFEMTVSNHSTQAQEAIFRANVLGWADMVVPETGSVLMALGGLGVAAGVLRRRRSAAG